MARYQCVWALSLLATACGSGGNEALDSACGDYAKAYCDKLDACQTAPNGTGRLYGSYDNCLTRNKSLCTSRATAQGSGATAANLQACATAYPAATCAQFFLGLPDCAPEGTLADGASCAHDAQCQSAFCQIDLGAACGTCAQSQAGDDCSTLPCGPGFTCGTDPSPAICHPLSDLNGPCNSSEATSPYCAASLVCVQGTCVLGKTSAGETCDGAAQTCADSMGLRCPGNQCAADPFVGVGETCGAPNAEGLEARCTGGSSCVGHWGAMTCLANIQDGDACPLSGGASCTPPARCVVSSAGATDGTCKLAEAAQCQSVQPSCPSPQGTLRLSL